MLSYILKISWWMNIIHEIFVQCVTNIDLNLCMIPIFHGPVILPYILKTIWWINVVLEILIQCDTNIDLNYICRSVTLFHVLVILPYILKTVWWTNVIIGILDSCDANIYHIKCMWVSDLNFMVQWFCLISWRHFGGGMLYWRYWFSAILSLTYKYICRSVAYILWYSDSALYIQYYLMNKPHSLNIGSVWYGPLTCISWFSNFESFIYFLPIVVCWSLIRYICDCSRLEIGQLFMQGARRGHLCTLTHL